MTESRLKRGGPHGWLAPLAFSAVAILSACSSTRPSDPDVGPDADAVEPEDTIGDGAPDAPTGDDSDAGEPSDTRDAVSGDPEDDPGSDPTADAREQHSLHVVRPRDNDAVRHALVLEAEPWPLEGAVVEFYLDDVLLRTDRWPPFVAVGDLGSEDDGVRRVRIEATWPTGSAVELIDVVVDHRPPEIRLVEPGLLVYGPDEDSTLYFEGVASDEGGLSSVEVWLEGSAAAPLRVEAGEFSGRLSVAEAGSGRHRLLARARDRVGLEASVAREFVICGIAGRQACGLECRTASSFDDDSENCGGCGFVCEIPGLPCIGGECRCAAGAELCGGTCIFTDRDKGNCGACDNACGEGLACLGGKCTDLAELQFVRIEGGEFLMGSPQTEFGRSTQEPQRPVTITVPYLMGVTEVTRAQWFRHFEIDPSRYWDCGLDCPVDSITWGDAAAFANATSEMEGLRPCYALEACNRLPVGGGYFCSEISVDTQDQNPLLCEGYRLPTEAEWEFAYRAGTTTATYAGPVPSLNCEDNEALSAIGWFTCNTTDGPMPVAQRLPNAWGLYDMAGNLYEWTGDYWRSDFDPVPEVDPWFSTGVGERGFRGGAWFERATRLRAATRLSASEAERIHFVGFRIARTAPVE